MKHRYTAFEPGIDQLPLFGQLFRSQDFINNQTELMVIVTP